jgi:hypothetical protein
LEPSTNDNDVTIVAIEADKEIQIAQINAEARVEESANYNEVVNSNNAELAECQTSISLLQNDLTSMRAQMTEILSRLPSSPQIQAAEIQETLSEEVAEQVSETLTEMNLTPQSISEPIDLTQTEALEESAEENQEPPTLIVGRKPIIRLV